MAVALVLLGAVACGGGGSDERADEPAEQPVKTSTTSDDEKAAGGSAEADPDELEPLVVTVVPTGYVPQPDEVGDTGPSDLEKAIRDDGDDPVEARERLEEAGFRRGYQRLWVNEDRLGLIVFLYEFEDREGALAQVDRTAELAEAQRLLSGGAIEGIRGSSSYYATGPFGATSVGTFVKGSYAVQVVADGATRGQAESVVRQVAQDQFERLP